MSSTRRLDPLAGEHHVCTECALSYADVLVGDAIERIRALPPAVAAALACVPPASRTARADPAGWSVTEYLCHLRDVHTSYTIRLYRARTENRPSLEPMYNELRAARFRYNELDAGAVLDELSAAVSGFCDESDRVHDDGWARIVTRLPGEERTARWLVRQTLHEGVHHLADIRRVGAAVR